MFGLNRVIVINLGDFLIWELIVSFNDFGDVVLNRWIKFKMVMLLVEDCGNF